MGTRSLTRVFEDDQELVTIYRQFDGYPEGHGQDLADFLKDRSIVNGIPVSYKGKISNGGRDLAAQLVSFLKKDHEVGGIYIEAMGASDLGEEYEYSIYIEAGKEPIVELGGDTSIFRGTAKEFINWIKEHNNE